MGDMGQFLKILCLSLVVTSAAFADNAKESPFAKATADIKTAVDKATKDIQDAADEAIAELEGASKVAPAAPVVAPAVEAPAATAPVATVASGETTVDIEFTRIHELLDMTSLSHTASCKYVDAGSLTFINSTYVYTDDEGESKTRDVQVVFSCPTDLFTKPEECLVKFTVMAWRGMIALDAAKEDKNCTAKFAKNADGSVSGKLDCKMEIADESVKMSADVNAWPSLDTNLKVNVQNCQPDVPSVHTDTTVATDTIFHPND
jgi:hypothetical protein